MPWEYNVPTDFPVEHAHESREAESPINGDEGDTSCVFMGAAKIAGPHRNIVNIGYGEHRQKEPDGQCNDGPEKPLHRSLQKPHYLFLVHFSPHWDFLRFWNGSLTIYNL